MRHNIPFVLCLQWTWREMFEAGQTGPLIQCWFRVGIRCLCMWLQAELWDFCLFHGSLCLCAIPYNTSHSQTYTMAQVMCRRSSDLNVGLEMPASAFSLKLHSSSRHDWLDFSWCSPSFAIKLHSLSSFWVANLSFSLATSSNLPVLWTPKS